jgi:hypothetical protein
MVGDKYLCGLKEPDCQCLAKPGVAEVGVDRTPNAFRTLLERC